MLPFSFQEAIGWLAAVLLGGVCLGCAGAWLGEWFRRRDTRPMSARQGLKDHQIAALVNEVTATIQPLLKLGCTRELVSQTVVRYLREHGLAIDHREGNQNERSDPVSL